MISRKVLIGLLCLLSGVFSQSIDRCSDYEEFGFYCVPYYQCKNNTISTDGAGIITIRTSEDERTERALKSRCEKISQVCCLLESEADTEKPRRSPEEPDKPRPQCGHRNSDGIGQPRDNELEPNQSKFGEWPHVCMLIEMVDGEIANYRAGASLLDSDVVITGAIKVFNDVNTPEIFVIRCGEWDAKNFDEFRMHQERKVEKIVIHPEFDNVSIHNNYAVLFLDREFKLNEHVRPACVPKPNVEFPVDAECYAQGWGKDKFTGQYQNILKSLQLKLVSNEDCENQLRETRLKEYFELDQSFLCAGVNQDTCTGDGGSPLVCKESGTVGTYVQVGIVSWGIDCGVVPGVYASLPYAACWIDKVISCNKNPQESALGYSSSDCKNTPPFDCP